MIADIVPPRAGMTFRFMRVGTLTQRPLLRAALITSAFSGRLMIPANN